MITIQAFLVLHNLRKLSKNTNTEMNMLGNSTEICLGYDYDKTYDYHNTQVRLLLSLILLQKKTI